MKITQTHSRKKSIVILAALLLLLISSIFTYAYLKKVGPFSSSTTPANQQTVNYDPPTTEEKTTGETIKDEAIKNTGSGSDPLPPPSPSTDGSKANVGVKITAASQSGDSLLVRSLIQTISTSGTCTLTMSGPAGKTHSATSEVQAGPTSTTCKGFNIPMTALAPGSWDITVGFENETVKGTDTMKGVVLQ